MCRLARRVPYFVRAPPRWFCPTIRGSRRRRGSARRAATIASMANPCSGPWPGPVPAPCEPQIMAEAQSFLERVARVALAPAVPQPGESLPGSAPALSARPLIGTNTPTDKPWAQLRSSLLASHCEGASAEVFAACAGGGVLTAWALQLGASPLVIGLLAALPVASNVLNLPATWLTHVVGRKPLAVAPSERPASCTCRSSPFPFFPSATRLVSVSSLRSSRSPRFSPSSVTMRGSRG